jgi:proline iminopeptidase
MSERFVEVNGARLWLTERGAGRPLMLVSGGPGCCDYLEPVALMIDDLARVYRFEPRGCGRSSPDGPYVLATQLRDLEALRQFLGHERWIVAGHSWGAFLALAYALEFPERTEAIIDLSGRGMLNDRDWHAAYEEGRDAGRDQVPAMAYPYNPEVNRIGNLDYKAYIKQPNLLRRIAEFDIPVLAIQGGRDIRPNWPVEQMVNLMPNAQYGLFEDAGHVPWFTHEEELRISLRRFLGCLR